MSARKRRHRFLLAAVATFAVVVTVHAYQVARYARLHPPVNPVATENVASDDTRPASLSALQLLQRDPPESQASAGALSLESEQQKGAMQAGAAPAGAATTAPAP